MCHKCQTHCTHVSCVCVYSSSMLHCNLSEAGMWVRVAKALWEETAVGYCLCTHCRGTSHVSQNYKVKQEPTCTLIWLFYP